MVPSKPEVVSRWINPPKQRRSRLTLERLLNASEEMLQEGSFQAATVPRIVERAGSSVGSFYSLFENKHALFECLLDRYQERMVNVARTFAKEAVSEDASLGERASAWVARLVSFCRQERGILRARVLHNILDPDRVPESRRERSRAVMDEIRAFFAPNLKEIRKETPERALDFALMVLDYTVTYKILLERPSDGVFTDLEDDQLVQELSSVFLSYLGVTTEHRP